MFFAECHLEAFPSEDAAPGRPCDPEYVYSLIVNDPRLTLPRQKEKVDFKSSVGRQIVLRDNSSLIDLLLFVGYSSSLVLPIICYCCP